MKNINTTNAVKHSFTTASKSLMLICLTLAVILTSSIRTYAARTSALAGGGNSAASLCAPVTDKVIYSFNVSQGSNATTYTGVNFNTTGTAVSGTDITNFGIWTNTSNSMTGATLLGYITTGLGSGSHSFSMASDNIPKNSTLYFFITTTIPSTANNGRTIIVSAMNHSTTLPVNYSGTLPTCSGSITASGAQTITIVNPITGLSSLCGSTSTTTNFSDATGAGTWASSNSGVATVSSGGLVTGISSGIATISYTVGSCFVTKAFSYTSSVPASISGPSTVCPPVPVTVLSESFENAVPPAGWSYQGTTSIWYYTDASGSFNPSIPAAQDGNYVAGADFWDYSGNSLMYSSALDMTGVSNGLLSFWVYRDGSGAYPYSGYSTEGFAIRFGTTPTFASGTNLGFVPRAADGPITGSLSGNSIPYSSGWYQYTVPIPATFNGNTNYLMIRAMSLFGNSCYIDNVTITGVIPGTTTLSDAVAGGTWSSSAPSVATVGGTGVVTGVATGTSTITYTNSCGYVTKTMTVIGLPAPAATICPSSTITLSNSASGGTWVSGATGVATVATSTGVVTGVSGGTASISYSIDAGCYMPTVITVYPVPGVITGNPMLCLSTPAAFSDATAGGTWTSSNTAVVTINSSNGVASTVALGTATITYTVPTGCTALLQVTVNPVPAAIVAPVNACVTDVNNPAITLSDATGSGVWISDNPAAATITSLGKLTGLSAGTTVITYQIPATGCYALAPMNINSAPGAITGNMTICSNTVTYLSDADLGGTWASSNTAIAQVDPVGVVSGVLPGSNVFATSIITYTAATSCRTVATVSVNPAPDAIAGNLNICTGSSNTLFEGVPGMWTSSNPSIASVVAGPATTTTVSGLVAGTSTISFTLTATGCYSAVQATVNPTPSAITPTTVSLCSGSNIMLNDADPGGTWSSTATIVSVSGGLVTSTVPVSVPTTVNIDYTYSTGCKAIQIVSINPLPVVYNLASFTGASAYCSGSTGIDLYLNNSTSGTQYQLFDNGSPIPGYQSGTGSALHFGNQTAGGTYTAVATDATTGCQSTMSGTPAITVHPLPDLYTIKYSGAGSDYCDIPGAGTDIILDNSNSTIFYTLNLNGTPLFTLGGTGLTLDFGNQVQGVYTATAEDATTHCKSNMLSSVTVLKNKLPDVHNVGVSDSFYCAGTTGVHVQLDYGNSGVNYELYGSGPLPLTSVSGSNSSIDFGLRTAGSYTVVARNATTGCTQAMAGTASVVLRPVPLPKTLTGGGKFCAGGAGAVIGLGSSQTGVEYTLYNGPTLTGAGINGTGFAVNFAPTLIPGTYTILGTNTTTGCTAAMTGSTVVTMNPALTINTVTVEGTGSYCKGGSGLHVYLSSSSPFVRYDLLNRGTIVGSVPSGTGSKIDFGLQTADSIYTVVATDTTSIGCSALMAGSPSITINSLPGIKNVVVTNGGAYCAGGTGAEISLNFSDAGVTYELYKNTVATGTTKAGANSSVSFGTYTTTATYTVKGKNDMTGCINTMNGSAIVTVNPLPVAYTMTGGGAYCTGGTGASVGLFNSATGVNYQLLYNGSAIGGLVPGTTGSSIAFGKYTATGMYTVLATDGATNCTNGMSGSKVITIDPLPLQYNVTGGGGYCAGGTGTAIGLDNSVTGVDYQLTNLSGPVKTISGTTGKAIDFGKQTIAGTYTVQATTVINSCKNTMNGSAMIKINALPVTDTLKGGGSYCAGDAGSDLYMSTSEPGVNYQLYTGGSPTGGTVLGIGTRADMGLQTTGGVYIATGTNAATGCASIMTGSVTVTVNPRPNAYGVTGGGTMCAGDAGFHINLGGSQTGFTYNLYNAGLPTAVSVIGTGAGLDFGAQTGAGSYTIAAINPATGCTNTMTGSGAINVNPLPMAFDVQGGGNYCTGTAGIAVTLFNSENDVNYQLYNGIRMMGGPVGGTGSGITFGLQTLAGTAYTVRAKNNTTHCASDMSGSVSVTPVAPVTPSVAIDSADGTACVGDVILYAAHPTNGGTAPTYTWKVNSVVVSTTGDRYMNIPATGDVVSVEMISNEMCALTAPVTASIKMTSIPYATPTASVSVTPGTSVCQGTPVHMSATTGFEGAKPGYSWMKNGKFAGTGTSYSYTPANGNDKDVIVFMLRSDYRCRVKTDDTVFSDPIVMTIDTGIVPKFELTASFGPIGSVGQIDTFTVTIDKDPLYQKYNYTYQWYIQGAAIPGADQPVYIDHGVYNNDVVSCQVTKQGACGNQSTTHETTVALRNVGVKQVQTKVSDINVIPNPNKGEFTVKGTIGVTANEEVSLELTDMLGQKVYTTKTMTHNGNLDEHIQLGSTLANGMYLLSVRCGAVTNVLHIVVEQ